MKNPNSLVRLTFFLLTVAVACANLSIAQNNIVFVFDASGSMKSFVDGKRKINAAREAMLEIVDVLPDGTNTALIAYGRNSGGGCTDIELIAPLAPLDAAALKKQISQIYAYGSTPIADSLARALDVIYQTGESATIILLSDGLETCGGDPCKTIADARADGMDVTLHVIGFDLANANASELECAAQSGGGFYYNAQNPEELLASLQQAVETTTVVEPAGEVALLAKVNDQLADVLVYVYDAEGNTVASGRTYSSESTNPRLFNLPPGTYSLLARNHVLSGNPEITFLDITITEGAREDVVADFSSGQLTINVERDNGAADAMIQVFKFGESQAYASSRTYANESKGSSIMTLMPGVYDILVRSLGIEGNPERRIEGVEISMGSNVERTVSFSDGTISIGVFSNGELADAAIIVYAAGENQSVARGRTYTSSNSNPLTLDVEPGVYDVVVHPLAMDGVADQRFDGIQIELGTSHKEAAIFDTGTLSVEVTENEALADAMIFIHSQGSTERIASQRSYNHAGRNPATFTVSPGVFDVSIRSVNIKGDSDTRYEHISVSASETTSLSHNYATGTLTVSTLRDGKGVDATVNVLDTQSNKSVASGRTYGRSKSWNLIPGEYLVKVRGVQLKDSEDTERSVTLGANVSTDMEFEL